LEENVVRTWLTRIRFLLKLKKPLASVTILEALDGEAMQKVADIDIDIEKITLLELLALLEKTLLPRTPLRVLLENLL